MKATEEKDGTYTLSGLTYHQLTSIISGLWAVVDKQKAYSQKLKEKDYEEYRLGCRS